MPITAVIDNAKNKEKYSKGKIIWFHESIIFKKNRDAICINEGILEIRNLEQEIKSISLLIPSKISDMKNLTENGINNRFYKYYTKECKRDRKSNIITLENIKFLYQKNKISSKNIKGSSIIKIKFTKPIKSNDNRKKYFLRRYFRVGYIIKKATTSISSVYEKSRYSFSYDFVGKSVRDRIRKDKKNVFPFVKMYLYLFSQPKTDISPYSPQIDGYCHAAQKGYLKDFFGDYLSENELKKYPPHEERDDAVMINYIYYHIDNDPKWFTLDKKAIFVSGILESYFPFKIITIIGLILALTSVVLTTIFGLLALI